MTDWKAVAEELARVFAPFVPLLQKHHEHLRDDSPIFAVNAAEITAGDLRRVVAALAAARKAGVL